MSTIDIRREYNDGDILLESDLDAIVDDIETFLNTTKINDDNIQTSGITASTKLVDASISTAKLANSAVTTAKINDDAVTTAKILDSNVTTAKIADSNVTNAKVAADSIQSTKMDATNFFLGKFMKSQAFTADGNWTVPAGVTACWVEACGGGGAGGGGGNNPGTPRIAGGAGGNGSCINRIFFSGLTPAASIAVVIGAGGTGVAGAAGNAGGDTSFNSVVVAKGGAGGNSSGNSNAGGLPGTRRVTHSCGGQGSGDDIAVKVGENSELYSGGAVGSGSTYHGGGGGAGGYGNGAAGGVGANASGSAAAANTGAGGGGGNSNGSGSAGGAGGSGYLVVYY